MQLGFPRRIAWPDAQSVIPPWEDLYTFLYTAEGNGVKGGLYWGKNDFGNPSRVSGFGFQVSEPWTGRAVALKPGL